ncbi:MAG: hypothetical protein K2O69_07825 [Odoribacter sp.]|nr:hypothetical protein [Odoribacter sp.]
MRKIVLLLFTALLTVSVFAQEPGAAEKNAGNAALKAKNYAEAFKQYEAYLKIVNNNDKPTVYNTAVCANKIKNYAAAEKYFDMSIKNNYKVASAYHAKALAQKDQKKTAEMLATLEQGMKTAPGNMKLETMYASHFMKEGQAAQKAGNEAKAVQSYTKITDLTNKSFKVQGLQSLATLYFNNGAKILQDATPIANTDKAKYDAEKAKAVAAFKKAKDCLTQAQSLEPANEDVKNLMTQVNANLK